jgi:hypothetical protein
MGFVHFRPLRRHTTWTSTPRSRERLPSAERCYTPDRVPPPRFLTALTACSVQRPWVCCTPQPARGSPRFRGWPPAWIRWIRAEASTPFPTARVHPSKNSPRQQPYRVTAARCPHVVTTHPAPDAPGDARRPDPAAPRRARNKGAGAHTSEVPSLQVQGRAHPGCASTDRSGPTARTPRRQVSLGNFRLPRESIRQTLRRELRAARHQRHPGTPRGRGRARSGRSAATAARVAALANRSRQRGSRGSDSDHTAGGGHQHTRSEKEPPKGATASTPRPERAPGPCHEASRRPRPKTHQGAKHRGTPTTKADGAPEGGTGNRPPGGVTQRARPTGQRN